MFRTTLLALGASAGLLLPAAFPAKAEAQSGIAIGIGVGRPGYFPPIYYPPSYYPPSYYPPRYYPPGIYPPVYQRHYDVLYRYSPYEPWRLYGTYHSHSRAHEVQDYLEWRGYEVRMIHR